jgi:hypothetical protein
MRERVLVPVGMNDTAVVLSASQAPRFTAGALRSTPPAWRNI